MVQRLLSGNASVMVLAREVGVSHTTISRWARSFGRLQPTMDKGSNDPKRPPRRTEDWTAQDRLTALGKASELTGDRLGAYLRREGLHEATLQQWRQIALEALQGPANATRNQAEKRQVKKLERELLRKDKALAEAAALLILKKKVQAIWGDEDDVTPSKNDD